LGRAGDYRLRRLDILRRAERTGRRTKGGRRLSGAGAYGSPAQSLDLAVTGDVAAADDATPITVSVPIQISDTAAAISSDLAPILADPQVASVIVSDGGEVDPGLEEALARAKPSATA
jgi:hypothetical protein